jgi:hypothetical protein
LYITKNRRFDQLLFCDIIYNYFTFISLLEILSKHPYFKYRIRRIDRQAGPAVQISFLFPASSAPESGAVSRKQFPAISTGSVPA